MSTDRTLAFRPGNWTGVVCVVPGSCSTTLSAQEGALDDANGAQ